MKKVLSIDGGGVRGYLASAMLDLMGARGSDFDMIVGTSTGGILALGLGLGLDPGVMAKLYSKHGKSIFKRPVFGVLSQLSGPKYNPRGLKRALTDVFGERTMVDMQTKVMVTSFDLLSQQAVLFKSWRPTYGPVTAVDAAMATSAAPTFFPPHGGAGGSLVDGGVFANNPSLLALTEASKLWPEEDVVVLSVGCGRFSDPSEYTGARSWGALSWLPHIVSVFMDSAQDVVDYQMRRAIGDRYVRIQPMMSREIKMDDASDDALGFLRDTALSFSYRNEDGSWERAVATAGMVRHG